jgi:hypothetical protein
MKLFWTLNAPEHLARLLGLPLNSSKLQGRQGIHDILSHEELETNPKLIKVETISDFRVLTIPLAEFTRDIFF